MMIEIDVRDRFEHPHGCITCQILNEKHTKLVIISKSYSLYEHWIQSETKIEFGTLACMRLNNPFKTLKIPKCVFGNLLSSFLLTFILAWQLLLLTITNPEKSFSFYRRWFQCWYWMFARACVYMCLYCCWKTTKPMTISNQCIQIELTSAGLIWSMYQVASEIQFKRYSLGSNDD